MVLLGSAYHEAYLSVCCMRCCIASTADSVLALQILLDTKSARRILAHHHWVREQFRKPLEDWFHGRSYSGIKPIPRVLSRERGLKEPVGKRMQWELSLCSVLC